MSLEKSSMDSFDSVVVGFGLAGFATARKLLGYGLKVAVISKSPCEDRRKTKVFGPHQAFRQSVGKAINIFVGRAVGIRRGVVFVLDEQGKELEVNTRAIVLATGALELTDPEFQNTGVQTFTLDVALEQDFSDKAVLVVGSDLESFLFAFDLAKRAKVTLLCRGEVLRGFDNGIKEFFVTQAGRMAKEHPSFRFFVAKEARQCDRDIWVVDADRGEQRIERFEALVVSGRKMAKIDGLGLEALGIEIDNEGFVFTDDRAMTRCSDVYAVGDCTGFPFLASKAIEEASVCASNIASKPKKIEGFRFKFLPHRRFPFAEMGMSEEMLSALGIRYARGLWRGRDGAFVKVLMGEQTLYGIICAGNEAMRESCVNKVLSCFKGSCSIEDLDAMLPRHQNCPFRKAIVSLGRD